MTRKQRCRGESQISYFLIVGLVILACFTAAATLGRELVSIIVGSDKVAQYMGNAGGGDDDEPEEEEPAPDDPDNP